MMTIDMMNVCPDANKPNETSFLVLWELNQVENPAKEVEPPCPTMRRRSLETES